MWKNAECGHDIFGEIKFRKNNKKNYFKLSLKVFSFILIAALSGGITAQFVINKDFSGVLDSGGLGNNNTSGTYNKTISEVARKVSPVVVGISNKSEGIENTAEGSGSGIIFKSDGYIITNYHVVEGPTEIKVKLSNDNILRATLVGTDERTGLTVIKVEASNLPVAKFGDSSKINVGDLAISIGNPLGKEFTGTVTAGIISATDREINMIDKKTAEQTIYKVIQTDATIGSGSSGGALCNSNGEVIGINSLKVSSYGDAFAMGFAINSNEAQDIINDLMTDGKVIRPSIGIYGETATSAASGGVEGVYVKDVIRESGAAIAGIMPTDIITEIGGHSAKNMEDLNNILSEYKVNDDISCKIWRDGKIKKISIVLSELKVN
ncbi:MAG: trypsin-like peptidase domain-containing protein [Clostridium sp.]|nr:trypsin-like peptidase domain-containing protein [Clostridium sp.]